MLNNTIPQARSYALGGRVSIDLSLSTNPFGCGENAKRAIEEAIANCNKYPERRAESLIGILSEKHGIDKSRIMVTPGAAHALNLIVTHIAQNRRIVCSTATFPEPLITHQKQGGTQVRVALLATFAQNLDALFAAANPEDVLYICNPNNPTGIFEDVRKLHTRIRQHQGLVVVSEVSADFCGQSLLSLEPLDNLIVVRSYSKSHGLAGLRIGYVVGSAKVIEVLNSKEEIFSVTNVSLAAAIGAEHDHNHLLRVIHQVKYEKNLLFQAMKGMGYSCVKSHAQNFIAEVPKAFSDAAELLEELALYDARVIDCAIYEGLARYIRVTPSTPNNNRKFIQILKEIKIKRSVC